MKITEKELQARIVKLIVNEEFRDKIISHVNLEIESSKKNEIPQLNIDSILRRELLKRARVVYSNLSLLEIVSGDPIKNISKDRNQRLYPDLVLHNPETNGFIVCELKTNKKTSRETATELLAYSHELKNHVPLIPDSDINMVVVANEFSPLLRHAISSLVLSSGINILPLKYSFNDAKQLTLQFVNINEWSITGILNFSGTSLQSYSVCFYWNDNTPSYEDKEIANLAFTACDLIKNESENCGLSGFVFSWFDCNSFEGCYKAGYTLVTVNSYSLFSKANFSDNDCRDTPLLKYLRNYINENGEEHFTSSSFEIIKNSKKLLQQYCNPTIETLISWDTFQETYGDRFRPTYVQSFGVFSKLLNSLYTSEPVRELMLSKNEAFFGGVNTPETFFLLFAPLCETIPFESGEFNLISTFNFSINLGLLLNIFKIVEVGSSEKQSPLFLACYFWAMIRFRASYFEINYRYRASSELETPPMLRAGFDPTNNMKKSFDSLNNFMTWFSEKFLINHPIHQLIFSLGLNNSFVFNPFLRKLISPHELEKIKVQIKSDAELLVKRTLINKADSKRLIDSLENETSEASYGIMKNILVQLDMEIFPVHHDLANVKVSKDILDNLKDAIQESFQAGAQDEVVYISAGGEIAIVKAPDELQKYNLSQCDLKKEVILLEDLAGIKVAKKITWDMLYKQLC